MALLLKINNISTRKGIDNQNKKGFKSSSFNKP